MSRKLAKANPYMSDPASRERNVIRSVISSSAIEGIYPDLKPATRRTMKAMVRPAAKAGSGPNRSNLILGLQGPGNNPVEYSGHRPVILPYSGMYRLNISFLFPPSNSTEVQRR